MAFIAFDLLRIRRRIILKNLDIAFGDEMSSRDRLQLARTSVYHFMLTALEFLYFAQHDPFGSTKMVLIANMQVALKKGRGVYGLCCHMGNWELMAIAASRFIGPIHNVAKNMGQRGADRFVQEVRSKHGFLMIPMRPRGKAVRLIRDTLKNGEIVGFMLDQYRRGGEMVPFWGKPAKSNTALAALWRRYPAPVIPAFSRRTAVCEHVIELLPEMEIYKTDNSEEDILRITAQFNKVLEEMIRRCPEQYFWMHNRWKD